MTLQDKVKIELIGTNNTYAILKNPKQNKPNKSATNFNPDAPIFLPPEL